MSQNNKRYKVADTKIAVEDFDGEFVVLNLDSGQYFSFADTAALIWQGLSQGVTPNELMSALAPASERAAEVLAVIDGIIAAALVVEADQALSVEVTDLPARIAAGEDSLTFEAFDDLAALLVADPIHDVEREAGWPHKAPE